MQGLAIAIVSLEGRRRHSALLRQFVGLREVHAVGNRAVQDATVPDIHAGRHNGVSGVDEAHGTRTGLGAIRGMYRPVAHQVRRRFIGDDRTAMIGPRTAVFLTMRAGLVARRLRKLQDRIILIEVQAFRRECCRGSRLVRLQEARRVADRCQVAGIRNETACQIDKVDRSCVRLGFCGEADVERVQYI